MVQMTKCGIVLGVLSSMLCRAEEGGTGHYMPGSMASFVDSVAAEPTLLVRYNLLGYSGDRDLTLPIAGLAAQGVDAESWANGLTCFWRPEWGTINEDWGYAMSMTIPYVDVDVRANVLTRAGGNVRRSDRVSGVGDIVLQPLMLSQHINRDWNINYRISVYAPTG